VPSRKFAEEVSRFCDLARQTAKGVAGLDLDFSPTSIPLLERALGQIRDQADGRDAPDGGKAVLGNAGLIFGAYLGEVVRREFGGEWFDEASGLENLGPTLRVGEAYGFPILGVLMRLFRGPNHNVVTFHRQWLDTVRAAPVGRSASDVEHRMAGVAYAWAMGALKETGVRLDFSVESLEVVDGLVTRFRGQRRAGEEVGKQGGNVAAMNLGAYLGEVVRRNLGGIWVTGAPDVLENLPVLQMGDSYVLVLGAVANLLDGRAVAMGETEVRTPSAYFRAVENNRQLGIDTLLAGDTDTPEAVRRMMSDDPNLAQQVYATAVSAVLTAETKWGVTLDFSEASLEGLETILGGMHEAETNPLTPGDPALAQQKRDRMVGVWGVYLGEVIRRHRGGRWVTTALEDDNSLLALKSGDVSLLPVSAVQRHLRDGPAESVRLYYYRVGNELARGGTGHTVPHLAAGPSVRLRQFAQKAVGLAFDFGRNRESPVAPFLLLLREGKTLLESYEFIEGQKAVIAARRRAADQPPETECLALVCDAYLTVEGERSDAFLVDVHERGAPTSYRFGQRYRFDPSDKARKPTEDLVVFQEREPILATHDRS
jgi:hypothetical protein